MPGTSRTSKQPVRMGKIFSDMLTTCPHEIQVYGACVADIRGGIDRSVCEKEFDKLRQCFQRTVRKINKK